MSDPIKVKDGDFVVTRDPSRSWRNVQCVEAIKVTKQMVLFIDTTWTKPRERRIRLQDVVFAGPEEISKRLAEQLTSSNEQKLQDQKGAVERQRKRDEGFIAAAQARVVS